MKVLPGEMWQIWHFLRNSKNATEIVIKVGSTHRLYAQLDKPLTSAGTQIIILAQIGNSVKT